jgi:hypothetical protein
MLGKQRWRLITEPTSLCARVLKGHYYPDTDFLSVGKPRSSSYTWRSIMFGRGLIQRGLRWGIGNGESVSVIKDKWVPGFPVGSFQPLTSISAMAKVCYLMNEEGTA